MPPQPSAHPGAPGPRQLTKGEFLADLQCHKQLWWRVHDPDARELVPDPGTLALLDTGREVGIAAREYVPGGQLITFRYQSTAARIAATGGAQRKRVDPGRSEVECRGEV